MTSIARSTYGMTLSPPGVEGRICMLKSALAIVFDLLLHLRRLRIPRSPPYVLLRQIFVRERLRRVEFAFQQAMLGHPVRVVLPYAQLLLAPARRIVLILRA